MIKKIYIGNIATYIPGVEFEPKKINFIYGANGTGKSTLSKVLSNEISSSECNIEWNTGTKEDVIVYNKGFVEKEGFALALNENLKEVIKNKVFVDNMRDVLEYRTIEYYRRRYSMNKLLVY